MPKSAILTGVGRDRVGIVAEVADVLYKMGCNMLDSSMTLLRGEFALIVMIELPDDKSMPDLKDALTRVGMDLGLSMHVRELSQEEKQGEPQSGLPFMISVYGADKPGIVAGITRSLADVNINITDVQTTYTGTPDGHIFVMMLEVSVPEALPPQAIEASLEQIGRELGVDISVQPIESYEL